MLNLAIQALDPPAVTCAVAREGRVVHTACGVGVKPLLSLYRERPDLLSASHVADTVIGKAAAVILVLSNARAVYGQIMSAAAIRYLEAHGIACSFQEQVPLILNRTGDGSCPLEAAVADYDDPQRAYAVLTERIEQLMAGR